MNLPKNQPRALAISFVNSLADRLYRWRRDGAWDRILGHVQTRSDAVGEIA